MVLKKYNPTAKTPWNFLRAWTLQRRVGFAATWSELQRDLKDGPGQAIDRLLAGESRTAGVPDNYSQMQTILGDAAVGSDRPERLIAWWVYQMYFSPDPLREKLTLVWHNHFATSNAKVDSLVTMRSQNDVFRDHGLGNFQDLLYGTLKHPAMLKWLDGDENRAGRANENLGRETLELFTLGVGNYTEADVKGASRALTGWSAFENKFRVREDWHDGDEKTILGKSGNFTGDDLIEITSQHPATPKRLAWRLCDEFLNKSLIDEQVIGELAQVLTDNDLNIQAGVSALLRSELFFSDENLRRRIVDPETFVVGAPRAVEWFSPPASTMVLGDWIEQLGRKLFYPPNVGGWPGGRGWLNSRTTIARANFGAALVHGNLNRNQQPIDFVKLAESHIGTRETTKVVEFYCQLLCGVAQQKQIDEISSSINDEREIVSAVLASPAAQLN